MNTTEMTNSTTFTVVPNTASDGITVIQIFQFIGLVSIPCLLLCVCCLGAAGRRSRANRDPYDAHQKQIATALVIL